VALWIAGALKMRPIFGQPRESLLDRGYITEQEFDGDIARLDDPDFVVPSPIMWTAWGRRPSAWEVLLLFLESFVVRRDCDLLLRGEVAFCPLDRT